MPASRYRIAFCLTCLVAANAWATEGPLDFGLLRFAALIPINDGEVHSFTVSCNKGACRLDMARFTKKSCDQPPTDSVWLDAEEYETTDMSGFTASPVGPSSVEIKFQTFIGTWTANADLLVNYGPNDLKSDSNISRKVLNVTGSLSGVDFYTKRIRTEKYTLFRGPMYCRLKVSE